MIIWRWNDRTHGGRVKVYPRALSKDWFFFFSVPWCLAAKAFRGGKNCNHLPSFSSPRIAPPPCPHSCPTVLVLLFRTTGRAVFGGVLLSPSVTLVGRGQDGPRRWLLAAWAFLTYPRTFLLSRRGPWAWYEMGRACQILRPQNSPSKSCCSAPQTERRVLMSSGPPNGLSNLILC